MQVLRLRVCPTLCQLTDFGPSQETAASQRLRSLTLVIVLDPRELGIKFVEMTGSVTVVVVVVEKNTTVNSY